MSVCARCGAGLACAMADGQAGGEPCWCTRLPPVMPVPSAEGAPEGCWCPDCLAQAVSERLGEQS